MINEHLFETTYRTKANILGDKIRKIEKYSSLQVDFTNDATTKEEKATHITCMKT